MKASIQLSANFIVVMVLTILVIGMGFAIFGKLFKEISQYPEEIDSKCEDYLSILLKDTDYAFCESSIKVESGKKGVAWLGINNIYDNPEVCYIVKVPPGGISSEGTGGLTSADIKTLPLMIESGNTDYMLIGIETEGLPSDNYAIDLEIHPSDLNPCAGTVPNVFSGAQKVTRKLFVTIN